MKGPTAFVILALLSFHATPVCAQAGTPSAAQAKPTETPEKAPPLFPKHRRGLYLRNDLEVIDATPQSPPLEIDDPSVPDKGEYEVNLLTEADLSAHARSMNLFTVDANYGIVLKGWGRELPTQIKFECPVVARTESGNPYQTGIGTSEFGLKFNVYNDESRGLRVSVYPQIAFSPGGSVDKGIAEAGQTVELPLLVSHESKYVTLVGNASVNKPFHDPERAATMDIGFGIGRAIFRKFALMGDIRGSSTLDVKRDRMISANAGFIYGVRKAIWYVRAGHSISSDDGRHVFFGVGIKMIVS
jgi:ribosomal protein S14